MNNSKPSRAGVQKTISAVFAALVVGGLAFTLSSAGTVSGAPSDTNSIAVATAPTDAKPAAPPRHLTGAELYSMHCNRCHPERYPTERTAAQWKTIVLHMQVRANIPPAQARSILKYLQENSGR